MSPEKKEVQKGTEYSYQEAVAKALRKYWKAVKPAEKDLAKAWKEAKAAALAAYHANPATMAYWKELSEAEKLKHVMDKENERLREENERLREFVRRVASHYHVNRIEPSLLSWHSDTVAESVAEDIEWLQSSTSADVPNAPSPSGEGGGAAHRGRATDSPAATSEAEDPPRCEYCGCPNPLRVCRDCGMVVAPGAARKEGRP